ncbi:hypothetical protein DXA67_10680 [Bacteroides fragilis]|nr:hypothetical protein DXB57_20250 [Bacteroides fragilis]RGX88126.1 hypothetical protein DXA67_10680 [Bacteroides fragilis]RHH71959.1 hypothetical protein DW198_03060 [Bacteroides fragilis]
MLTSFPGNAYCFCRKSRLFTSSIPALHLRKTGFPAFLPLVCRSFKESLFVKQLISFLNVFLSVVIPFFMIFPLFPDIEPGSPPYPPLWRILYLNCSSFSE